MYNRMQAIHAPSAQKESRHESTTIPKTAPKTTPAITKNLGSDFRKSARTRLLEALVEQTRP